MCVCVIVCVCVCVAGSNRQHLGAQCVCVLTSALQMLPHTPYESQVTNPDESLTATDLCLKQVQSVSSALTQITSRATQGDRDAVHELVHGVCVWVYARFKSCSACSSLCACGCVCADLRTCSPGYQSCAVCVPPLLPIEMSMLCLQQQVEVRAVGR